MQVTNTLMQVRQQWCQAYFGGDLELLDRVEADSFVVTFGHKVMTKADHLRLIRGCLRFGKWYQPGSQRHDLRCEIKMRGTTAVVCGVSHVMNGKISTGINFSEIWSPAGDSWQVKFLYCEEWEL